MYEELSFFKKSLYTLIIGHLYLFFLTKIINDDGHLDSYWNFLLLFFKIAIPIAIALTLIYLVVLYFLERRDEKKRLKAQIEEKRKRLHEKRSQRIREEKERLKKVKQAKKIQEELKAMEQKREEKRRQKSSKEVLR